MDLRRRHLLRTALGSAALSLCGFDARSDEAQAQAPRLLVVLLRGGMDGLTAVPPVADEAYERLRPTIAVRNSLKLDGRFGLHPQLSGLHELWGQGQLAIVHSAGFSYTGRSHFEGQDVMQTGVSKPYTSASGWLGRAMETAQVRSGVAISIPMPMILRGSPESSTQFPNWMPRMSRVVADELTRLWMADPALAPYASVIRQDNLSGSAPRMGGSGSGAARTLPDLARLAALEMREPLGPRVGLIDITHGFDTHASQGAELGAHAERLSDVDQVVTSFRQHMGERWRDSLVLSVTEFGRTAAENGTTGTDHGVGSCCFLAGGLVGESRVYADWRGLAAPQLFESRDLPATIDVGAVHARVIERVLGLNPAAIQSLMPYTPSRHLNGLLGLGA